MGCADLRLLAGSLVKQQQGKANMLNLRYILSATMSVNVIKSVSLISIFKCSLLIRTQRTHPCSSRVREGLDEYMTAMFLASLPPCCRARGSSCVGQDARWYHSSGALCQGTLHSNWRTAEKAVWSKIQSRHTLA